MARPHPVVGISSEFTHGCRGSTYETHISVDFIHYEVLDIVVVESGYLDLASWIVLLGLLDDFLACFLGVNHASHVLHAH